MMAVYALRNMWTRNLFGANTQYEESVGCRGNECLPELGNQLARLSMHVFLRFEG